MHDYSDTRHATDQCRQHTPDEPRPTSQRHMTHMPKTFTSIPTERPLTPLLDTIDAPAHLKGLSITELLQLADELRAFMLYSSGISGGHFGANLGVIELTVALHALLDMPQDQLVWDVGHQAYAHKILTGRRDKIASIRSQDGLTAFPERGESVYDSFGVGHSSTAISAGLGMSLAMRHLGKHAKVACVVGDGAMTGGMAFEAMNDAVQNHADLLVVLNDNDMSISQATGGFSKHLASLWQRGLAVDIDADGKPIITSRKLSSDDRRFRHYLHMTNDAIGDFTNKLPKKLGEKISQQFAKKLLPTPSQFERLPEQIAVKIAQNMFPDNLFKAIGFAYFGPFDGHDLSTLMRVLGRVKQLSGPILVHVHTVKGKGFLPAEADPVGYHAIAKLPKMSVAPSSSSVSQNNGQDKPTKPSPKPLKYSQVFGQFICDKAFIDSKLMAITPAMEEGSGMSEFAQRYPKQFFDVAIAEQHAVTLAAGMATQGVKPIVAIYSTFLQRGYDQLVHDVALQKLDVLFAIDRAGLVGEDGATHAGVFDIAFMRCVPNMVIATPKDENECYQLLNTCYEYQGAAAVRYPRGQGLGEPIQRPAVCYEIGKSQTEMVLEMGQGTHVVMLAFGTMVATAKQVAQQLADSCNDDHDDDHDGGHSIRKPANQPIGKITVINMRWVKPLDTKMLDKLINDSHNQSIHAIHVVTLEEHAVMGGAGSAVNEYLLTHSAYGQVKSNLSISNIGIPDRFIHHGSHEQQLAHCGLDAMGIQAQILQTLPIYQL